MFSSDTGQANADIKARETAIARLQNKINKSIIRFCIGSLLYAAALLFCLFYFAVFFDSYFSCLLLLGSYLAWFWAWAKQLSGWMAEQEKLKVARRAGNHSLETMLRGFHKNLLIFRKR